ncbi:MAG: hypothetical protein GOMPHAMPRED_003674 [Gomphillus americanus]|uniref:Uncharacterized protein n=1 Tax=Gomphillus americanus TaxID=1940652 RepID=A0A8H3FKM4_9LECA|nr:MAG: hypothetical protein GOMPHAMPRED_003674 [Gomphillus americanus]
MKLCIIAVAFPFTGLGAAFLLIHCDEDLALQGRDTAAVPPLLMREHENDRNQLSRVFSNKILRRMVKGELDESQEVNSEPSLEGLIRFGSPPSINVETNDNRGAQAARLQLNDDGGIRNISSRTKRRDYTGLASNVAERATRLNRMHSRLEARGKEASQSKASDRRRGWNSQSSSVSTSPFGTPRAQAGPSIERPPQISLTNRRGSFGSSGELVNSHLPGEPSQLSRENSFEHITPTVETIERQKTSTSTKLYRGTGVGIHYVRNNPKEAGLVALSAFGQAASVGALGPLVYGSKGVGMAVAGVGAVANFAAYSGQAATNVKKWQKSEAKIPKEKQGEPLNPLIDATKAIADRSSHLTSKLSKGAVKPFQIAGGQLKKVVPGSMDRVHSEPNLRSGNNERRSEEYEHDGDVQDVHILEPRTLQLWESQMLQARSPNALIFRDNISSILLRRGTPPEKTKGLPAKDPTHGSASMLTSLLRDKSPSRKSPPKDSSTSGSVSGSTAQSRNKSPSDKSPPRTVSGLSQTKPERLLIPMRPPPPPPWGASQASIDTPARQSSISPARSRLTSPQRSGMRRTTSDMASIPQVDLHRADSGLPFSTLERSRSGSPRPQARTQGRFKVMTGVKKPTSPVGPSKRPVSSKKQSSGEFLPPKSTFQAPLSTVPDPQLSKSPPKRTQSGELAELDRFFEKGWSIHEDSPFAKIPSPGRSTSPPKRADSEELRSPKSAFSEGGFESPTWAANVRSASPPPQTRKEAEAELRAEEKKIRPDERQGQSVAEGQAKPAEGSKPTSRFTNMPLFTKMRQEKPRILVKSASGSSASSSSSPFGSPEYQARPPFRVPSRDFSRDWPQNLYRMGPALPEPPPESP